MPLLYPYLYINALQYLSIIKPNLILVSLYFDKMFKNGQMKYNHVGKSGLQVSSISFGFWTNMNSSYQDNFQLVKTCLENGINYFDTAQTYCNGQNQEQIGKIMKLLNEDRSRYVISTKIWKSKDSSINTRCNTNKKHVRASMIQCLKRLQMDYVDIVFAHSFDQQTPLSQICEAFHEIIQQGFSFYWGTSNWDADRVIQAISICEKRNFHKPIVAQNQYNMINRKQIEQQYRTLFQKYGYGLFAYSPLLGGYLTGKYLNENNEQGRFQVSQTSGWAKQVLSSVYYFGLNIEDINKKLVELKKIAQTELDCKLIHLAIAWVLKFEYTSTALVGARNCQQLKQLLKSVEVMGKMDIKLQQKINSILGTQPNPRMDWKSFTPSPHLRPMGSY